MNKMNIKRIIREELDDFDWVKKTEDPLELLERYYKGLYVNKDGPFIGKQNISTLLKELKLDYKALFGLIRQPNKIYWEITDVHHPVKELFSYEGFKNPNIRKAIKNYYKEKINNIEKRLRGINESDDFDWVRDERDPWADIPQEDIDKLTEDEMDLIYYIFEWDDEGWRVENNCIPFREIIEVDFDEGPDWSRGVYHGIKRELFVSFKVRCSDADDWVYVTAFIDRDTHDWHVA